MKRYLSSNLFYGALSIVMAVFLMFYVASLENPVIERSFHDVRVEVNGLPDVYLLESEPGHVEIRASGHRSAVNLSFSRDVKAFVDLHNASPGTGMYPIQYLLPSGLSLVFVRPESIALTIDELDTIDLPVSYHTVNAVRAGYYSEEPILSPPSVTLSGPKQVLNRITKAVVTMDLHERAAPFDGRLPLVLLDQDNEEIKDKRVSLNPDVVDVAVKVSENISSKSVSVRTALSGNVSNRYIITGVEMNPSSVKISGSYSAISSVEYLMTETIDLTPLTDSFSGFVNLITPPGVTVLDGDRVALVIGLEKNLIQRTLMDVPVEIRNAPDSKSYYPSPGTVHITLTSFPDQFEAAMVNGELSLDMRVYVDMKGQIVESAKYPLHVDMPEVFTLTKISEDAVTVQSDHIVAN